MLQLVSIALSLILVGKEYTYEAPIAEAYTNVPTTLQHIATCESDGRQFNDDGIVLRGRITPTDVGKFQISTKYWSEKAHELGFDLYTEQGNTEMALYLYNHYGTDPWNASRSCWQAL